MKWRSDDREKNIMIIQWKSSNFRIYKKIFIFYVFFDFNKQNFICVANNKFEKQKMKKIYKFTKHNKSILQEMTFVYFSTKKHSKSLFHSNIKFKRYFFEFYKIKWIDSNENIDNSWKTRIIVRRVWKSNAKRANFAIWKTFIKIQIRHKEWKQDEKKAKNRSSTSYSNFKTFSNTISLFSQSKSKTQSISTSFESTQYLTSQTTQKSKQQIKFDQTFQSIQQITFEFTSEFAQKKIETKTQTFKSMNVNEKQKKIVKQAFMNVMFDIMKIENQSILKQYQIVTL